MVRLHPVPEILLTETAVIPQGQRGRRGVWGREGGCRDGWRRVGWGREGAWNWGGKGGRGVGMGRDGYGTVDVFFFYLSGLFLRLLLFIIIISFLRALFIYFLFHI